MQSKFVSFSLSVLKFVGVVLGDGGGDGGGYLSGEDERGGRVTIKGLSKLFFLGVSEKIFLACKEEARSSR